MSPLCTPVVRLAWHLEQTSPQELGNLSTSGESVLRKGSDSAQRSAFGKEERKKTILKSKVVF